MNRSTQAAGASFPTLAEGEEHHHVVEPASGRRLFLRRLATQRHERRGSVLYVHGATFPSALSVAHRFDARSWRDALCEAGFDVWGFDFFGFGFSDSYPAMDGAAEAHPPLGLCEAAATQLDCAARFILVRDGRERLSIVAHSWGTMVAGRFAGACPDLVERLVMFAPICQRGTRSGEPLAEGPAWRLVSAQDQWTRFVEDVPADEPPVLSKRHFEEWARLYLDTDPHAQERDPPSVKVPTGPSVEILRAWQGALAYDPSLVRAPTAIIRGAWDNLCTDEDARWLFDALSRSSVKRDVKIARGTHLMHLETMRFALWQESVGFLLGDDTAPPEA